jgi:hypothetical protein
MREKGRAGDEIQTQPNSCLQLAAGFIRIFGQIAHEVEECF